jgi:hypothetical protein
MTARRRRSTTRRRLPSPTRLGRTLLALGAAAGLAGALSGCAQSDAAALARQTCDHVDRSLALYHSSMVAAPRVAAQQQAQAQAELDDALQTAATAAGEAGQYQALAATLAESAHVPESLLVHALTEQCQSVQAGDEPVPDD